MNISIIGTGYVGLVTGACFAELGMNVICMDVNEEKISELKNGIIPIYEDRLENIIKHNYSNTKRLKFTTSAKDAVESSQVIFITVGTPSLEDGTVDLQYVLETAGEIGKYINDYKVIVSKSTVPIGTGKKVQKEIAGVLKQRKKDIKFDVVSNPEFLREGSAVKDFMNPDRIVIGAESDSAVQIMKELYNIHMLLDTPIIVTNIETAEMIKYAANAFLATKISYINEIANICEFCNADVNIVSKAMGMDNRIGDKFLNPGPGFGGSCFPKDTKALMKIGKTLGYEPQIVKSALRVNTDRKKYMFNKIKRVIGDIKGKSIAVLGISYKPETDDIRDSIAIPIIQMLLNDNANVKVFDPKAMTNAKNIYPDLPIEYCNDLETACENCNGIILFTEWKEFYAIDFGQLKTLVKEPIFIDLRNVYSKDIVESYGFLYEGVGVK